MLDTNHVLVCLEPVNSTSVACDVRALLFFWKKVHSSRFNYVCLLVMVYYDYDSQSQLWSTHLLMYICLLVCMQAQSQK